MTNKLRSIIMRKYRCLGGEGVHLDFCVKVNSEIAVDQQTKVHDRTYGGSGCPPVPAGQPRPCLVNFWHNFAKSPKHAQNHALGCSTCNN